MNPDSIRRFWNLVEQRDAKSCWLWKGCKNTVTGYGVVARYVDGKVQQMRAHRLAYLISFGDIPPGMCVCHTCDTPLCCNPKHLWLGTFADNNRDRDRKGRRNSTHTGFTDGRTAGERNVKAKLTERQIQDIWHRYLTKSETQRAMARRLGVHFATINRIVRNRAWRHLAQPAPPSR